jgi:phospholipid/cholesterol/gamma-HCH transport system permease protein
MPASKTIPDAPPSPMPSKGLVVDWIESVGAIATGGTLWLWNYAVNLVSNVGEVVQLFGRILKRFPWVFRNPELFIQQVVRIGTSSLSLIIVISVFIGAVTAIQANYQFRGLIPDTYLGTAVCKFVIIESGPVLTALVLAGRIGSAIAAEIGSMKEKEELDAMVVLDLDPLRYLAMPRILAGLVAFPLLVIISDFLAIIGGWLVATQILQLTSATYAYGMRFLFDPYDVWVGFLKALVFGGIVVTMGYYHGLKAGSGARGVGQASMRSVVASCVLILIADFLIVYAVY